MFILTLIVKEGFLLKTNTLIIGGGITGILTAYFLHQKNIPYILIEKDELCSGVTKRTTAKITYQHNLIYSKIAKQHSFETAQKYLQANKTAFNKYRELCSEIECDYEIKNNYVYSFNDRSVLEEEAETLEKIGYHAEFCENINIPVKTVGALCFKSQAQFNVIKFLKEISKNLNVMENTFIREIDGNVAHADSLDIKAEKIIVTTHFPFINKHGNYFLKLYQDRSYVIALENEKNPQELFVDGMYIDESGKGLSFRNYENLLFIGGGSHRTGKKGGNYAVLRDFASKKYPYTIEKYHWATQDCMSLDGIPYIGNYSLNTPNLYTATGFNKWGMTSSMVAAMILCDLVTGEKNTEEFADIFNPSRSILKPQLLVNGFESVKNLLSFSTKRCPHLGCALKWNPAEHTWDCPCHGSRFTQDGKLINNPAIKDIKGKNNSQTLN